MSSTFRMTSVCTRNFSWIASSRQQCSQSIPAAALRCLTFTSARLCSRRASAPAMNSGCSLAAAASLTSLLAVTRRSCSWMRILVLASNDECTPSPGPEECSAETPRSSRRERFSSLAAGAFRTVGASWTCGGKTKWFFVFSSSLQPCRSPEARRRLGSRQLPPVCPRTPSAGCSPGDIHRTWRTVCPRRGYHSQAALDRVDVLWFEAPQEPGYLRTMIDDDD
mmetsp:Transcript_32175/g.91291  ORF Transcript_32175/g.91291 Transcript_32175/m.91291 type:complete len:223 (-) Transcript_32175:119-787(-)